MAFVICTFPDMYTCIMNKNKAVSVLCSLLPALAADELHVHFSHYDVKRLGLYSQNMVDYHLIMDLLPALARLYFLHRLNTQLSAAQAVSTPSLLTSGDFVNAYYKQYRNNLRSQC